MNIARQYWVAPVDIGSLEQNELFIVMDGLDAQFSGYSGHCSGEYVNLFCTVTATTWS